MVSVVPTVSMTVLCSQFLQTAASDNAYGGYCAKGVANILEASGLGYTRGNAHTWDETLPENGWQMLEGVTPENAPPGAVLVYDRDTNYQGKGGGAQYGHVEIVAVDANGDRKYVSDAARSNWGGTVPGNFVGVYINPKLHQPVENGSYSTTLLASNTPSTNSPSNGSDTPQVFQDAERQRREINDLILRNAQLGNDQPNTTQDFNDAANATHFILLAAILEVVFGVKMDLAPATDASTTEQTALVEATPDTFTAASTENTANTVTTIGI
ncbi:MAG: hypothetical protein COB36_03275 [Alphaproteobacteria bacterium]|nr:MAG: hypothetical protein COB36_03275 [Alphaproteobacteria bacterium]